MKVDNYFDPAHIIYKYFSTKLLIKWIFIVKYM